MLYRILCLFIFAVVSIHANAQEDTDSLRALYIQEYPDRFSVWPVLKQRDLNFTLRGKGSQKARINYSPNNAFTFGFGAYLFDLVVEATFAIPLSEKSKTIYGESSATDLQANILSKKFAADVYYQKYQGFYIDDKTMNIPADTPYPQRSDIITRNTGLGAAYVLNHRRFSLRSAFNYVDRQLHSRGSVLIGGSLNTYKISADSAIIFTRPQNDLGPSSDFRNIKSTTLAVSAGYSYTFIYRHFFINGTLATGPGRSWINYETPASTQYDAMFNLITTLRVGIGYNNDRFFGGIGYSAQSRSVNFDDLRLTTTSSLFRAVIGYRFNEFGILKKRASDLVSYRF
jgi:hypothetical protein